MMLHAGSAEVGGCLSLRVSEANVAIPLTVGEITSSDKTLLAKTGTTSPTILATPARLNPVRKVSLWYSNLKIFY